MRRSHADAQGAIEDCDAALELDPGNFAAFLERGNANLALHNVEVLPVCTLNSCLLFAMLCYPHDTCPYSARD